MCQRMLNINLTRFLLGLKHVVYLQVKDNVWFLLDWKEPWTATSTKETQGVMSFCQETENSFEMLLLMPDINGKT